jgi:hypothetical protein
MKKTFIYILVFLLNIGWYFFLQIIASFVQFGLFGSGNISAGTTIWVSLCFLVLQLLILFLLYKKQVLMKDMSVLIVNVLMAIGLFLYFAVYLTKT